MLFPFCIHNKKGLLTVAQMAGVLPGLFNEEAKKPANGHRAAVNTFNVRFKETVPQQIVDEAPARIEAILFE
jgi:hypothetical protein